MINFEYSVCENADNNDDEFCVICRVTESKLEKNWTGKIHWRTHELEIIYVTDWMECDQAQKISDTLNHNLQAQVSA